MEEVCDRSSVIAVVEVVSVEPGERPSTFYMWTRVLHVTKGAGDVVEVMRLIIGGNTSCDYGRPWPVGSRHRVFLGSPGGRFIGVCTPVEEVAEDEVLTDRCSEERLAVDRAEEAERERQYMARYEPRVGCASCAVSAPRPTTAAAVLPIALLARILRRRTRRRATRLPGCRGRSRSPT